MKKKRNIKGNLDYIVLHTILYYRLNSDKTFLVKSIFSLYCSKHKNLISS